MQTEKNDSTQHLVHKPDKELLNACIHCGFCLTSCPTYVLWGDESDSPRGRIQFMKMLADDELQPDRQMTQHFDSCLGCEACATACPSGVQYGALIEETRAYVAKTVPRRLPDAAYRALLFSLFPYPKRLRAMKPFLWLYQKSGVSAAVRSPVGKVLPRRLRALDAVLPSVRLRHDQIPVITPPKTARRLRAGMITGCVQDAFFSDVNAAAVRVLTAEGVEVITPPNQGCCGALHIHSGREEGAMAMARSMIDIFERAQVDVIVIDSAGCGSTLKRYDRLLQGDAQYAERAKAFVAKVKDISEVLSSLPVVAPRHPIPLQAAYHDACHLSHAQKIREAPRNMLRTIPQLEIIEIPEGDICCGSAGIYNLTEPAAANALGTRKAQNILSVKPHALVASNPGCLLQISASLKKEGVRMRTYHPIELVDMSIRGALPNELTAP